MIQDIFNKPILIFGCGNLLLGDDGFGPETINYINLHYTLPDTVLALDMGTSVRDLLFDLILSTKRPECIFIFDAVSFENRRPGELIELEIDKIPSCKVNDFSLHQFPSVNLLQELHTHTGVEIRILAVQAKSIPDLVMQGLSPEIKNAIPKACVWLEDQLKLWDSQPLKENVT